MPFSSRLLAGLLLAVAAATAVPASTPANDPGALAATERAFIDYLDARDAAAFVESGSVDRFEGRDLAQSSKHATERRTALNATLSALEPDALAVADRRAVETMRRSLAALDSDTTVGGPQRACSDALRADLDYRALRAALVECFVEHGNHMRFEGQQISRGTALELLHVLEEPARRKAIFDAFAPLWTALNGRNERDSPYRRLIAMAAADAVMHGSEIDAAARAIGIDTAEVERWLVQVLEAGRDSNPARPVEPWDFRYVNSAASRRLQARIPPEALLPVSSRFYRDLGADLTRLKVTFDLTARPDKSPVAYTDFLRRGRQMQQTWRRPLARVVATYPEGGLFSLNELVHENGHAVHLIAIRTRPGYMDWPDTLCTEAFADVPAWSVHEPAWQRRYLGVTAPECESQRAMFGNVMLDVAWSLFELRLLRDPATDPSALWADITSRYLGILPHPELPWWALRVQLVESPGYMVNYGLGAILTAEIRAATIAAIGPFDAGNAQWYEWNSARLLRFGSERDTRSLMTGLLGRAVSPEALLRQLRRCRGAP